MISEKKVTLYEIQMLAGVKVCNTCTPPDIHPLPQTSTHHHVTEYLPPCLHHLHPLHFSCLSSPLIFLSVRVSTLRRQEELCFCYRGREGKVRPSPLLCLCYHFSHLYPLPASAPLTPSFLSLTYS